MPGNPRIQSLAGLLTAAGKLHHKQVLVAAAADDDAVLDGISHAMQEDLIKPVLIGHKQKIAALAGTYRVSLKDVEVIDEPDPAAASLAAVKMCRDGSAQILMKGLVPTAVILKAVLNHERGLSTGRILSHVAVFEPHGFGRLLLLADAGMNINPDLARKIEIIKNTVALAECLGIEEPKVAALAAVETVKAEMPATTEAALIAQMSQAGQLGKAVVAGPYALDLAISEHAAKVKGVSGPVAGRADILLAPDIEAGNILYKALVHFAGLEVAALVLGAKVPIIICSRSDSGPSKLYSIALAALMAGQGSGV